MLSLKLQLRSSCAADYAMQLAGTTFVDGIEPLSARIRQAQFHTATVSSESANACTKRSFSAGNPIVIRNHLGRP